MNDRDESYELYKRARDAMEGGRLLQAIELFAQSIALFPHPKALELIGECLLHEKETTKALLYLGAAVGLGTKQARARFLLARCVLELGYTADAKKHLKEALRLQPGYRSARELRDKLPSNET
ncbi:MAG: tetratricopeptide repeat protein [Acidobacteria bacterium]|nr:tetratricopeptide repeat protein [Acidobacteriota bacterium]